MTCYYVRQEVCATNPHFLENNINIRCQCHKVAFYGTKSLSQVLQIKAALFNIFILTMSEITLCNMKAPWRTFVIVLALQPTDLLFKEL